MRQFYLAFPIRGTLCHELSWSHYRYLIRIENPAARTWYMEECATQNWSVRALERQIGTLYYERLLSSQDKAPVKQEAAEKTKILQTDARDYLRDPLVTHCLLILLLLKTFSKSEKNLQYSLTSFIKNGQI